MKAVPLNQIKWEEARRIVLETFGNHLDGDPDDDPCFYCSECEEPLYKEEFPYFRTDMYGYPICPICENVLN